VKQRRTVRVFVFDEAGRVLLIRCAMVLKSGEEFVFWVTPGGEIESGEEPRDAAVRELREELGLELEVRGPLYTEANRFELGGEMRDNLDHWFVTRCAAEAPKMKGVTAEELAMMQEMRWWSADEVEKALKDGVKIFPVDLASRMGEFA
jgi:8-oxo-dGTP pyrophosphatase MutT (NUDIX family)